MKVVEENSVILHDNVVQSHLNKDGMHLNSYGTTELAAKFIFGFGWNSDITRVPVKNITALLPQKHQTSFRFIILILIEIRQGFFLNI